MQERTMFVQMLEQVRRDLERLEQRGRTEQSAVPPNALSQRVYGQRAVA